MTPTFSRVSVIGLGYVGLPTAATLASRGVEVIGVDKSPAVVDRINQGLTHIIEPDLDAVVQQVVRNGKLRATLNPEPAQAFLIAVPTPIREDNSPDMAMVESATAAIAPVLKKGDLVIIESTSPVGTTERAEAQLKQLRPDLVFPKDAPNKADILMAYCPERVLPGRTLKELVENARLVGGLDEVSSAAAKRLYQTFVRGDIRETHARVAEMSKLSENAFRDVNVAFANELSLACDALDVDVWKVIELANLHPRVNILWPGAGVGGHCIPIDPWFIHHAAPHCTPLIRTAREVNLGKTDWVVQQIRQNAKLYENPRIALLGLAYKPDIDDLRESPAMHVAEAIAGHDWLAQLNIVEPHIEALPKPLEGRNNVALLPLEEALRTSDVVALLVSHTAFTGIRREHLAGKSIIDTSGVLRAA
ncbi:MAG: UDP-N-acetyl-D-mannosamine dehydrogenase [Hyphomonadaceae bacterium]|nr:UDP-N-acetyl-D-mannosamine dehydrogenase [Hyphomonadaceae bacterium]